VGYGHVNLTIERTCVIQLYIYIQAIDSAHYTAGATSGTGNAYPSGAPEFTSGC